MISKNTGLEMANIMISSINSVKNEVTYNFYSIQTIRLNNWFSNTKIFMKSQNVILS